jgi:putative drug exporter of the RND superfamily
VPFLSPPPRVLATWLGLLVAVGAVAGIAGGTFSSNFTIPGTESQRAIDLLAQKVPATRGATGRIVFAAPAGQKLNAGERAEIHTAVSELSHNSAVASVSNPFTTGTVSASGRIAYADLRFVTSQAALTDTQRQIVSTAAAHARSDGLQVGVSGDAAPQTKSGGATEGIGILAALLVLTITFGSLLSAGMPLLTAAIGVGIGLTGITALSALTDLSSAVTSLAAMLGLAVGIDYALFIISRYRALARQGMSRQDAAGQDVATAGTAVVFAGSTVIIALGALLVTGVPFMQAMGFCAAGTVAIAVLIAVTLVPALLWFAGPRALKGKRTVARPDRRTMGLRWVDLVVGHRGAAIGLVSAITLVMAIPVTHLRLGLPADSSKPVGTPQRTAGDLLTQGFGQGFNGQLTVVAELPSGSAGDAQASANTIRERLVQLPDVATVAPATVTADRSLAIITLTPSSGPTSVATTNLVHHIRNTRSTITAGTRADLSVTGTTAVNIDVANRVSQALLPYLAVIVGLAFILLAIAFRSLLVPLTAVGGFLLSIAAALGAMVAVFQDGTGANLIGVSQTAPIVSLIPIITIGILFGLAMDYQVFLVSGMREAHAHGASAQDAVRHGFRASSRVVTAAGLIMISVFAGFILPDDPIIKSIGFALTAGVLIDAFLIRMTLIPALMSLLGHRAWYLPRLLDRLIPNVDIEGTAIQPRSQPRPANAPALAQA